jgi:hypothetical protein
MSGWSADGAQSVAAGPSGPVATGRVRLCGTSRECKYWQRQGWQLNDYNLDGWFRTPYGAFGGTIELSDSGDHKYYIIDPPRQLQGHNHAACFRYRGNNKYWVHFSVKPSNVDEGIQTVETVLREAIERHSN